MSGFFTRHFFLTPKINNGSKRGVLTEELCFLLEQFAEKLCV
jgi:hypothetical protein